DVNREFNHELAVFGGLGVVTHAADGGNSRTFHQRCGIRADEQRDIGGHPLALLDGLLDLSHIYRLILWPALRRDLIPPAINAETDDAEKYDCENYFSTSCHKKIYCSAIFCLSGCGVAGAAAAASGCTMP